MGEGAGALETGGVAARSMLGATPERRNHARLRTRTPEKLELRAWTIEPGGSSGEAMSTAGI